MAELEQRAGRGAGARAAPKSAPQPKALPMAEEDDDQPT